MRACDAVLRWHAAVVLAAGLIACSPVPGSDDAFRLLIFPGEAELGGSATAVISSNYVYQEDGVEDYQLDRSRVGVRIRDDDDEEWNATVRAVFPLSAAATSQLAHEFPGAWATVVLFDLPTDPAFDLGSNSSFLADVIVAIDGELIDDDTEAIGSIRITGRSGTPTSILWPPIADLELDAHVIRFRPRLFDPEEPSNGGFPPEAGGTTIAGIEADLVYVSPCVTDAEVYTGTEGSNAGVYLGPEKIVGGAGFVFYRRLVVTYPEGFVLKPPVGGTADALGQGPLIEVAYDRPTQSYFNCDALEDSPVWLWNVYAVRPDRSPVADQRGIGSLNESSDLFALHPLPADSW